MEESSHRIKQIVAEVEATEKEVAEITKTMAATLEHFKANKDELTDMEAFEIEAKLSNLTDRGEQLIQKLDGLENSILAIISSEQITLLLRLLDGRKET